MKKALLIIVIIIGFGNLSSKAKGGGNGRFSVGPEIGLPLGNFGDAQGIGFGGTLRYEMPVGNNLGITGTAGYLTFTGKNITVFGVTTKGESTYLIPVQAGLKYYFMGQQEGFYGHVMLGVHMYKTVEATFNPTTYAISTKNSVKAALSYAPEIGYHLDNLDFGLRYQLFTISNNIVDPFSGTSVSASSTSGYVGLRVAYVFGEK